jgi:hypothetical protein
MNRALTTKGMPMIWNCARLFRLWLPVAAVLSVLVVASGNSHAQTFSYDFDSWSGSGNGFGESGVIDDFNDGDLMDWTIENGTAIVSGGVLNLRDPGSLFTAHFPSFDLVSFLSHVVRDDGAFLADGLGDFTVTTAIKQTLIPVDDYVGLNVGTAAPHYFIALVVQNFGPEIGAQEEFEEGLSAALYINAISSIDSPTEATVSSVASVRTSFNPVEITGDIHLRLDFNDAANEFTGSFSTDGGGSFTTIGTLPMVAGWGGLAGLSADPRQLLPASVPVLSLAGIVALLSALGPTAYRRLLCPPCPAR